jgi:hypothetical protein
MAKRQHAEDPNVYEQPGNATVGREDPLLEAVIDKLPEHGPWYQAERDNWLKLLGMALDVAYGSAAPPVPVGTPPAPA